MNILATLFNFNLMPVMYGIVIFIGILVVLTKVVTFHWFSAMIDIAVFWIIFSLHGGTMTGAFAAAIAAMLAGLFIPLFLKAVFKLRR